MAANCSRCGAALTPGSPVCPACGAAVTAAAVYPPAMQNFAPPPSSGTSALKVVLIVVAIFVGLGIIAVGAFGFLAWRVSKSIHMSADGKQMTVNTPGGSFTTNTSNARPRQHGNERSRQLDGGWRLRHARFQRPGGRVLQKQDGQRGHLYGLGKKRYLQVDQEPVGDRHGDYWGTLRAG